MIDLVLRADSRAALVAWGESNPPGRPLIETVDDGEGGTRKVPVKGIEWSPWAGSGSFMTDPGTGGDPEDPGYVAPTYHTGYVAKLRVHGEYFDADKLSGNDPENDDEFVLSALAKYIKDNGTPGTMGSVNYYEVAGVRVFKQSDVDAFCAANNIPNHGFL